MIDLVFDKVVAGPSQKQKLDATACPTLKLDAGAYISIIRRCKVLPGKIAL